MSQVMKTLLLTFLVLAGCLDNSSEPITHDASVDALVDAHVDAPTDAPSYPSCASLGCPGVETADRICAQTGVCYCGGNKSGSMGERCCVAGIECAP